MASIIRPPPFSQKSFGARPISVRISRCMSATSLSPLRTIRSGIVPGGAPVLRVEVDHLVAQPGPEARGAGKTMLRITEHELPLAVVEDNAARQGQRGRNGDAAPLAAAVAAADQRVGVSGIGHDVAGELAQHPDHPRPLPRHHHQAGGDHVLQRRPLGRAEDLPRLRIPADNKFASQPRRPGRRRGRSEARASGGPDCAPCTERSMCASGTATLRRCRRATRGSRWTPGRRAASTARPAAIALIVLMGFSVQRGAKTPTTEERGTGPKSRLSTLSTRAGASRKSSLGSSVRHSCQEGAGRIGATGALLIRTPVRPRRQT